MDDPLNRSPPSPASSASSASDSDAFNTADAKIHFGPLKSPEKKFVPTLARRSTLHPGSLGSPLRRSPRLSTPRVGSPVLESVHETTVNDNHSVDATEVEGDFEDIPPSRSQTPENEQVLPDEPSSALAIRVIRAYDNPSPPPSPRRNIDLDSPASPLRNSPALNTVDTDSLNFPRPENDSVEKELCVPLNFDSQMREPSRAPPTTPRPQHDLISFESFSTPAAVFRFISPLASASSLPLLSKNPSVDDLFNQTPSISHTPELRKWRDRSPTTLSLPQSTMEHDRKGKGKAKEDLPSDRIDEQTVNTTFSVSDSKRTHESSPLVSLSSRHTETTSVSRKTPQTPVWRSTRPRRSGTPYRASTVIDDDETSDIASMHQSCLIPGDGTEEREQHPSHDEGSTNNEAGGDAEGDRRRVPGRRKSELARTFQGNPTHKLNQRELGSLSPTSTSLLIQLLPSPAKEPSIPALITLSIPEETSTYPEQRDPSRRTFPELSGLILPHTPQRSTSPVRFLSPVRPRTPHSPSKARIQLMSLDDPNRTPARRIPIEVALAQGHMSSLKAARLMPNSNKVGGQASRTLALTIPPLDSPARRVNVSEIPGPAAEKKWQGIRFGSPSRAVSKERLRSTEPQPLGSLSDGRVEKNGQRAGLTDSSFLKPPGHASASTMTPKPRKLPFPIVASRPEPSAQSEAKRIPNEDNMSSPAKSTLLSSPLKSTLKQTTSRIPRTIKPYARHTTKMSKESQPNGVLRAVHLTDDIGKSVTEPVFADTEFSSDDAKTKTEQVPATRPAPVTLKRKRAPEKASSFNRPRPVVLLRQVPRAGQGNVASTSKPTNARPIGVPAKKPPQQIRRVIDRPIEPQPSESVEQDLGAELGCLQDVAGEPDQREATNPFEVVTIETTLPCSPNPLSSPAPQGDNSTNGTRRRTTRIRKTIKPATVADVFNGTDARALPPRRRAPAQLSARTETAFSGMSAVALKALTSSNTVKNQRYLAAKLETEVIRREGARPESPTVKIRTISQRQQDEKGEQRKARADRRARRSEGGSVGDQSETEEHGDGGDYSALDSDSDFDDRDSSPIPRRHKRGPGDEDDYETPIREPRLKRLKLGENEGGSRENERRVKWDRGLFTTIYLDQVKLGTRQPPKDNKTTKGCLAPTAKALPLDNLGNLPHADSPLADLVEESVVVKKFVYDNDEEPIKEVILVKNTRLRSKKGKS